MGSKQEQAKIAHNVPGRLRIKLPRGLSREDRDALVNDLKKAEGVSSVRLSTNSLVIHHRDDDKIMHHADRLFPGISKSLRRASTTVDEKAAWAAQRPLVNKGLPLLMLGLAAVVWKRGGSFIAGETVFGICYFAFDLYWKFQQENVIAQIHKGMSDQQNKSIEKKLVA